MFSRWLEEFVDRVSSMQTPGDGNTFAEQVVT